MTISLDVLPDEILIAIFEHVELVRLVRLERTCRRWRAAIRQVHSINATNIDLDLGYKSTTNVHERVYRATRYLTNNNPRAEIASLGLPIGNETLADEDDAGFLHELLGSFEVLRHLDLQVHYGVDYLHFHADSVYIDYATELVFECTEALYSFSVSNLLGRPMRAAFEIDQTGRNSRFYVRTQRSLSWLCEPELVDISGYDSDLQPFPLTSLAFSLHGFHVPEKGVPRAVLVPWKDTLEELALDLGRRCCDRYSSPGMQDYINVYNQPPIVMSRLRVLFFSHFGYKLEKEKGIWNFVCPNLRDLMLKGNSHGNSIFYDKFLGDRLESLSVFEEVRPTMASRGLGRFIGLCPNLKILHIVWTGSARKIEQHAEDLIQCLTDADHIPIEQLTLMGPSTINQQSLVRLVKSRLQNGSPLRYLCVLTRSDVRHWLTRKTETWLKMSIATAILHTCSVRVCCHTKRYDQEVERLKETFPGFQPARFKYEDFVRLP